MTHISEFDYDLPQERIAQTPLKKRDESKLLCLHTQSGTIEHKHFYDIANILTPNDVLVFNQSRVIPARLHGQTENGGTVEVFLLQEKEHRIWEVMGKPGKKMKKGSSFFFHGGKAKVIDILPDGHRILAFDEDPLTLAHNIGEVPLPPYIHTKLEEKERYQTVFSKTEGSVAAPTAGLHFTHELIEKLTKQGVQIEYTTLHVWLGTFQAVQTEHIEEHQIHSEYYEMDTDTASRLGYAKSQGKRIIPVGTTAMRVLETVYDNNTQSFIPGMGDTNIYITKPKDIQAIDALITNFHVPKSSLMVLVSALAGKSRIQTAYKEALDNDYRFLSFGDAMFIH